MMIMIWGMMAMLAQADPVPALVPPQVAVGRVRACGFAKVGHRYDKELQEEVLEIGGPSQPAPEQLACAAKASLETSYFIIFPAPQRDRYDAVYQALSKEKEMQGAKAWLSERGLLSQIPAYAGKDAEGFARILEKVCHAPGALDPSFERHALSMPWMQGLAGRPGGDETLLCLMNASAVSGFRIGFIGHEAPAGQ
jgi:hypothetical protein